jgi:hypothetical protein
MPLRSLLPISQARDGRGPWPSRCTWRPIRGIQRSSGPVQRVGIGPYVMPGRAMGAVLPPCRRDYCWRKSQTHWRSAVVAWEEPQREGMFCKASTTSPRPTTTKPRRSTRRSDLALRNIARRGHDISWGPRFVARGGKAAGRPSDRFASGIWRAAGARASPCPWVSRRARD